MVRSHQRECAQQTAARIIRDKANCSQSNLWLHSHHARVTRRSSCGKRGFEGMKNFVFTMTTGRSGTTYLAELARLNVQNANCYHEILGWDRFGIDTPEVSHLTLFNSRGNIEPVRQFWKCKLSRIMREEGAYYCETSHLLMKAGLIENIKPLTEVGEVHLIEITRDPEEIAMSLILRGDFSNIGNMWMWYLDPTYPRNLLKLSDVSKIENLCVWYVFEMRARAAYYRKIASDIEHIHFHEIDMKDLVSEEGAEKLLSDTGAELAVSKIRLPGQKNAGPSRKSLPSELRDRVRRVVEAASGLDVEGIAEQIANRGPRF